jgi:hypothetical protein
MNRRCEFFGIQKRYTLRFGFSARTKKISPLPFTNVNLGDFTIEVLKKVYVLNKKKPSILESYYLQIHLNPINYLQITSLLSGDLLINRKDFS